MSPTTLDVDLQDDALREQLQLCAALLRTVADRWRFRTNAGRLSGHPPSEVARLIEVLETTASAWEGTPPPARPDAGVLLAESEQRFRLLVDGVKDYAIYMLDREGRIGSWNTGAERIKGYTAEEVLGRPFALLYTPEDVAAGKPAQDLRRATEEGTYGEEGWRQRRDGSRFWASVYLTALRSPDGKLLGFAKVTQDMTRRRRAEEALRRSEERFRLLVDGVQDYAIFMLDPSGRVASWNPGARRMKGYEASEILGRHFSAFYPAEDLADGKPEMELAVAREEGRYEEEGWRLRKDGSRFWANVLITAVRDADGRVAGFAKVTRDVTERRRADEALRRANDELEHRVQQRTQELERAYGEMEAFGFTVSHDLRSPLRTIESLTHRIEASGGAPMSDEQNELLERIRRSVRQMGELTENLLELSRVMRAPIVRVDLDLTALAQEVMTDLRSAAPGRVVELVTPGPLPARADRTLVRTLLQNLLENACKFTRTVPSPRIELGVDTISGTRRYFVRDNGVGFDNRYAHKLFLPFERLHTAEAFEGTGVGLASVSRVARRHGGDVAAEGAIDQGATFWFSLGEDARGSAH